MSHSNIIVVNPNVSLEPYLKAAKEAEDYSHDVGKKKHYCEIHRQAHAMIDITQHYER